MKLIIRKKKDNLVNNLKKITKINNFTITYNDNGKPLSNKFYFSKSTKDKITVIVTDDKPIGVDIERIRDVPYNIFFSDEENKLDNYEKIVLWTKKEAYIKRIGGNMKDMIKPLDGKFKTFTYKNYIITINYL